MLKNLQNANMRCIFTEVKNKNKTRMTTQEMTNTVIARVNEMKQNVEIQKNNDGF